MVVDAETPRDRGDPSAAVEHRAADASDDLGDPDHERVRNAHGSEKPTEDSESFRPRPPPLSLTEQTVYGGPSSLTERPSAAARRSSARKLDQHAQERQNQRITTMGEIQASVTLENSWDRENVDRGLGVDTDVRQTTVEGIVDTGALNLVIPEEIASRTGAAERGIAAWIRFYSHARRHSALGERTPAEAWSHGRVARHRVDRWAGRRRGLAARATRAVPETRRGARGGLTTVANAPWWNEPTGDFLIGVAASSVVALVGWILVRGWPSVRHFVHQTSQWLIRPHTAKSHRPREILGLRLRSCIQIGGLHATATGFALEIICNARCAGVTLTIEYLCAANVVQSQTGTYTNLSLGSNFVAIIPAPPLFTFDTWDGIRVSARNRTCSGCGVRLARHAAKPTADLRRGVGSRQRSRESRVSD